MAITDKEIEDYWNRFHPFIIRWFCVSLSAVLSLLSFLFLIGYSILLIWFKLPLEWFWLTPLALLMPGSILLKYGFGFKNMWYLNNTKDGDCGDPEEIKKANLENKSKLYIIIWWWLRNHSYGFMRLFLPNWNNGQCEEIRIISTSLTREQILNNRWQWCSKNGIHGHHYIAARIKGKVEVRFSEAGPNYQRQMGSAGNEYRFRFKGIWTIFANQIKRIF